MAHMAPPQQKYVKDGTTQFKLVRVICTDPYATESSDDGSGADEDQGQHAMSKRFVREIPLSAACSVLDFSDMPPHRDFPSPRRSPVHKNPAMRRKVRKKGTKTEEDFDAVISSASIRQKRRHHNNTVSGKLEVDADEGDCYMQEPHFSMFFSELLGGPKEYGKSALVEGVTDVLAWKADAGEAMASDIMDLELDSEAMTWINSLQR